MTKQKQPTSWAKTRDIKTTKKYIKHIQDNKPFKMGKVVKKFKYWVISQNLFPYRKDIFKTHHVLWLSITSGVKELQIEQALQEYELNVLPYVESEYHFIGKNTNNNKSHNSLHYHLFKFAKYNKKELI